MTKGEIKKLIEERTRNGDSYEVRLETEPGEKRCSICIDSTTPMTKLDFILVLLDWLSGFISEKTNAKRRR